MCRLDDEVLYIAKWQQHCGVTQYALFLKVIFVVPPVNTWCRRVFFFFFSDQDSIFYLSHTHLYTGYNLQ